MSEDTLVYRIDSTDTIVGVSDNWCCFATGNAWHGCGRAEDVVGRPLWDFIQGFETRHLYQEVVRRVRGGKGVRPLPFRCDSPSERRFLELALHALPAGHIEFTSRIVRIERRCPVSLLETSTRRSKDFLTICSVCKKFKMSPEHWAEIEEGLACLRLFEGDDMPRLSHGLCPRCFQSAIQELQAL